MLNFGVKVPEVGIYDAEIFMRNIICIFMCQMSICYCYYYYYYYYYYFFVKKCTV